eukprot:1153299-Pelagomonas_calceolata.AAC.7
MELLQGAKNPEAIIQAVPELITPKILASVIITINKCREASESLGCGCQGSILLKNYVFRILAIGIFMGPIGRGEGWWVLGVSAMRARVWAAGSVEANVRQTNPNFQDSDNEVQVWAWASAAQFLPHNFAATQCFSVMDMQMDRDFAEKQI